MIIFYKKKGPFMKHNVHLILLLICILSYPLTAMEGNDIELTPVYKPHTTSTTTTTTTTSVKTNSSLSLEQIVTAVDEKINAQYLSQQTFVDLVLGRIPEISEKGKLKTMRFIIDYCDDNETKIDAIINALGEQNSFFRTAFDFFITKAQENITHVTVNTIDTVIDPTVQQPTPILNLLPLILKKVVMNRAKKSIPYNYTMNYTIKAPVIWLDMCSATKQAIIRDGNEIILWNLDTGKQFSIIQHPYDQLYFNQDGSRLVAVTNETNETGSTAAIKIFELELDLLQPKANRTHECNIPGNINDIVPLDNKHFLVSKKDAHDKYSEIALKLKKNNKITIIGPTTTCKEPRLQQRFQWQTEDYAIYADAQKLQITRKDCYAMHLCEQAIKNAQNITQSLNKITQSQTYQSLTPYEQSMIQQAQNTHTHTHTHTNK